MSSSFLSDWKKWPLKVPSSQLYDSILWTGTISLVEGHSILLKIVFLLLPLWTAYRKRANIQILFTHVRFNQRTHWGGHLGGKHQQNLNHFPKWSLKSVYRSVCLHRDKTHPTWKHRWEPTEPSRMASLYRLKLTTNAKIVGIPYPHAYLWPSKYYTDEKLRHKKSE